MKVSKNWIQKYVSFELAPASELIDRIGSQLGGVEGSLDMGAHYSGVVIVKVVECSALPNSDHLQLCFVDDAGVTPGVNRREDGLAQVVCGAANVMAGVTVAWLPPGSTVPSTFGTSPVVLEARELRGTISNGMLASAKELAIGDSHEGLLLLDATLQAGMSFAEAYKLNDLIIDIENKMFTHRPDCFGILGVAREVAGIYGERFSSPDWYATPIMPTAGNGLKLRVENNITSDVPRLIAVALSNVTVKPSPLWLQTYLSRIGMRPINNLVDITNYLMILTGQPLHAYDYDKVAALSAADGAVLAARYAKPDEQLELLSGKIVTPRQGAIVIATDSQAIGLAGVMGGANTEVDAATQNIILECASFDMYAIRRTSMAHGLFTDAVTRFNKGQSPLQNPSITVKAIELFQELAGAELASEIFDISGEIAAQPVVNVATDFINARLGLQLTSGAMARLLVNVEFLVTVDDDILSIQAPFWRTDIEQPEDIVEEIGRLHGFDALPNELPQRDIAPAHQDALLQQKIVIRNSLVAAGANELLTYSFVPGELIKKSGQSLEQAFKLSNALSPELQYYRYNALGSLLDKVHANIKAGYNEFALFELSKGHAITMMQYDGLPHESELLDFVYASKHEQKGAPYYYAQRYLQVLAKDLALEIEFVAINDDLNEPVIASFDIKRTATVKTQNGLLLGYVGEFKPSVVSSLKLPRYAAGFSIDRTQLFAASLAVGQTYLPLPRFPKIEQDICLRVQADMSFAKVRKVIAEALLNHKLPQTTAQLTPLDIYRKDEAPSKQITFRISLTSYQRTLTDEEMNQVLQAIADEAANKLNAQRV